MIDTMYLELLVSINIGLLIIFWCWTALRSTGASSLELHFLLSKLEEKLLERLKDGNYEIRRENIEQFLRISDRIKEQFKNGSTPDEHNSDDKER